MDDLQNDIGLGILVAWLIVSVVFGAIGAAMASEKGASGGAGFLVGFLFNAVGLIIVMLMSPSVEVEARRRIAVEREMARQSAASGSLPAPRTVTSHRDQAPPRRRVATGVEADLEAVVYGQNMRVPDLKVIANRVDEPGKLSGKAYESGVAADTAIWFVWSDVQDRDGDLGNPHERVVLVALPLDSSGRVLEVMRLGPGGREAPKASFASVLFMTQTRFQQLRIGSPTRVKISAV